MDNYYNWCQYNPIGLVIDIKDNTNKDGSMGTDDCRCRVESYTRASLWKGSFMAKVNYYIQT